MDGYRLLQTTAPISHGSSGGPLFNASGDVIGITTLTFEEGQNLNFAIPIDYARRMLASPSQPRPLVSVYNPEAPAETPAPPSPPPVPEPKVTVAKVPPPIPDEMRQNVGVFLEKKLHIWTLDDVQPYLGSPLGRRPGYDNAHNIISDIYNYADPTALYQHIELTFDGKTKQMMEIFMYPARMTWDDCKKAWGDNATVVKNPDGSQFHNYKNRHFNIYLDRRGSVISIAVY